MKTKLTFLLLILLILLAACSDPQPLTQERLDAINCQIGDLPRDQTYEAVEGRPPSLVIFSDRGPSMVSTLAWNDINSSRQTFSCTLLVFPDVASAQNGLHRACDELLPPIRFPNIGDLTCQAGSQEVVIVFQKDVYLVWVWADFQGEGIQDVAKRLESRLIIPVVFP